MFDLLSVSVSLSISVSFIVFTSLVTIPKLKEEIRRKDVCLDEYCDELRRKNNEISSYSVDEMLNRCVFRREVEEAKVTARKRLNEAESSKEVIKFKDLLISEIEKEVKALRYAVNIQYSSDRDTITAISLLVEKMGYDRGTDYIETIMMANCDHIEARIKNKLEQL